MDKQAHFMWIFFLHITHVIFLSNRSKPLVVFKIVNIIDGYYAYPQGILTLYLTTTEGLD